MKRLEDFFHQRKNGEYLNIIKTKYFKSFIIIDWKEKNINKFELYKKN